jgi:hypothetical protein
LQEGLGAVAQLGERCVRNAEVEGSTPFRSTSHSIYIDVPGMGDSPHFAADGTVSHSSVRPFFFLHRAAECEMIYGQLAV